MRLTNDTALVLIDFQLAILSPRWGRLNNPDAIVAASLLLLHWRMNALPVIHIRHDSTDPGSTYATGQPGHAFLPPVSPTPGETIVAKETNSAFVGTGLEAELDRQGISDLVVAGVLTQNSVETTVRHGGNLGYRVYLAADACRASEKRDLTGRLWPAEDVHQLSLANLQGEYAEVTTVEAIIASSAKSLSRRKLGAAVAV